MVKHTALIVSTLIISSVSFGYQKLSAKACTHRLFEEAGAFSQNEAQAMCDIRDDKAFVDCSVRLYNQIEGQEYTFETATRECEAIIPLPGEIRARNAARIRQNAIREQSLMILKSLGFSPGRSFELASWMAETQSMALARCVQISFKKERMHPDSHVESCYEQFQRGELTPEGYNKVELERQRIAEEKRRQEERRRAEEKRQQELRRQAEAARQAELRRQADLQRKEELRRQDELRRQSQERLQAARTEEARQAALAAQKRAEAERLAYERALLEQNKRQTEKAVVVTVPRPTQDIPQVKSTPEYHAPVPSVKPAGKVNKKNKTNEQKNISNQDEERRWWEEQRMKEIRAQEEAARKKEQAAGDGQSQEENENKNKKKEENSKPKPPPTIPEGKQGVIIDMPNPLGG